MKNLYILFVLILSLLHLKSQDLIDTKGRDFWLTFLPNYHNIESPNIEIDGYTDSLYIFIVAEEPCSGVIEYTDIFNRKWAHNFQITDPTQIYKFSVPYKNFELRGFNNSVSILPPTSKDHQCEKVAPQSFNIRTDKDVTVYAHQQAITTSESMTCLPTDALGKDYIILSYNSDGSPSFNSLQSSSTPSQFAVVATEDGTEIEITPKVPTYVNKSKIQKITLNKGESYLVQAEITPSNLNGDLTGSIVKSNNPIVVISGHQRTKIPVLMRNGQSRDCLLEMLPPVNAWGRNAIVIPFAQHPSITTSAFRDIFRILAGSDNTQISIDGEHYGTLNQGEFFELELTNPWFIEASGPILVAQYKKTAQTNPGDNARSDPLMMITPPIEQYGNFYRIANIQAYEKDELGRTFPVYDNHFVNIVVLDKDIGKITIDGNPIDQSVFKKVPNSLYSYAILQVQPGTHELKAPSGFGLSVYGYGFANSYGYYGGMNLVKYDFTPPVVKANISCYELDGVITDSTITDTKISSIEFAQQDIKNVEVSYNAIFNTAVATFHAKLINKFLDGEFSVKATDSSGLYSYMKYQIPGFTVSQKGMKEDPNPIVTFDTVAVNKEICYKLELENYGNFSQTINKIILKYKDSTQSNLTKNAIILDPKTTYTLDFCLKFDKDGLYEFDIILEDTCSTRTTHSMSIWAFVDKTPPSVTINADPCQIEFQISATEILKTDAGIQLFEITEIVNGEYSTIQINSKESKSIFKVLDPRQDASFTVIVRDSLGNEYKEKITIPGYTLAFYTASSGYPPTLDFGQKSVGFRFADTISITNYGNYPITLNSPSMKYNILFSIPQSQFPININPGETAKINVIYKPTNSKRKIDIDTIFFTYKCLGDAIPVIGTPVSYEVNANSRCQVPLVFQTDSIPLFLESSLKSSVVKSMVELEFWSDLDSEIALTIYDLLGNIYINEPKYSIPKGYSTKSFFVENWSNQIYLIKISVHQEQFIFKFIKQ